MRVAITPEAGEFITRDDVREVLFEPITEVRKYWFSKYERDFIITDTYKDGILISQTIDTP